jgi:hypothetical protein
MIRNTHRFTAILAAAALSPAALAQFDSQWVGYHDETNARIHNPDGSAATQVINNLDEKHFAYGDFNNDGWIDLVMVCKEECSYEGMRRGHLLMNEGGVLVERTTQYGTDSDYPGSQGLLDLVDSRKAVAVDVNHDGLLDIVTCATNLGPAEGANPKYISHPRVYINKGFDVNGAWLGFRYEESRIPTLIGANGQTAAPRFCSIAAGDVTGDGFPDLYAVQYHDTETGYSDSPNNTNGDRLLINDGNGFFSDSGTTRMSQSMLNSAFGTECKIVDLNGDGVKDVFKCSTLGGAGLMVAYNNPANVGFFNLSQVAPSSAPYHIDVGDLNNDGKLDYVESDDGQDFYYFNTGNDALGRVIWSSGHVFTYVNASDDGFGSQNHIRDLNNDGWADVIISDVDHDLPGCDRRTHIFHNQAGTPGSMSIELREEAGSSGWFGANGLSYSDLSGTFDEAIFDIDNDGDMDIVFGRCTGTTVFINQESNCTLTKYGTATPNTTGLPALIDFSGTTSVSHNDWVLKATQCPHNKTCLFIYGTAQVAPIPFGDGVREIGGTIKRMGTTNTGPTGNLSFPANFTTSPLNTLVPGDTRYFMLWFRDPAGGPNGYNGSTALQATICP